MYQPSDFLERDAALFPDRLAVVAQGVELSYARLDYLTRIIAKALRKSGIARGDKVAFLLGNSGVFPIVFQALMMLGAVAVPLNKRLLADDIAYMLEHVDARALFFDSDMSGTVAEAVKSCAFSGLLVTCGDGTAPHVAGAAPWHDFKTRSCGEGEEGLDGYGSTDDHSLILFTSGTTGRAKAVVRTAEQVSMLATIQLIAGHSYESGTDVLYTQAPLYHMGGLCALLKMCAMGGTLIIESHFDPAKVCDLIERYDVNQLYMIPPRLFSRLHDAEERAGRVFPGVRQAQCAGGRTRDRDREAVFALFPNARIRTSFGSSESGMTCTSYFTAAQYAERPERGLTVGKANPFVIIKLVDEQGAIVPVGQPGEALVKSPQVFAGYLKQPEATSRAFDKDGFFHTGDILYLDEEGYFVFVDRISDMIKTGGENVFAIEVERVVQQFPSIEDCAVIGVDDNQYGEGIAAAIVLKPDAATSFTPEALTAFCKEHLPSFKKPRYLAIVDEIPRNNLGKVQKTQLRARQSEFRLIV